MALNRSGRAIIEHRRHVVAGLRLRGLTIREIVEQLPQLGVINEKLGKPWSRGIIGNDLQALEAEWRARAQADIAELKARLLAELREVRRAAWAEKDHRLVLSALESESKLLGLDAPRRSDVTLRGDPDEPLEIVTRVVRVKAWDEDGDSCQ